MIFNTKLVHQDVLAICSIGDVSYAAIGGWIYTYKGKTCQSRRCIFQGQKIHDIRAGENCLVLSAGKFWSLCHLGPSGYIAETVVIKNNDWILEAEEINQESIVLITSHNEAQVWDKSKMKLIRSVSPSEKCILYSAKIHVVGDQVFALAGTVFSEVLVWEITGSSQSILYRLKGHKGVIFSISVSVTDKYPVTICTTSDDRSVRLYFNECFQQGNFIAQTPLYAHTARVWKAVTFFDHLLTIGEDSFLCAWDYNETLISKIELHQGGGIRSIACNSEWYLTGGSDGGIYQLLPNSIFKEPASNPILISFTEKEIPRKVSYFDKWGMVCLTNKRLLFRRDHGDFKEINEGQDLFPKCTDMATAENLIGLSTVTGHLLIYHLTDNVKLEKFVACENAKCTSLKWRDESLMVGIENGGAKLFETIVTKTTTPVAVFQLPKCKDWSFTCFLRIRQKKIVLIGDRNGNLHVFDETIQDPIQTMKRVHSYLGISDIHQSNDIFWTIGAGGRIKQHTFIKDELCTLKSFAIPMESCVKFFNTKFGPIVAGFHGSLLKLWNLDHRLTIGSFPCGGGHRSYDFRESIGCVNFLFIKDKNLYQVPFELKFGRKIREGFHSKMINCLKVLDKNIIVSGGDDNTLRISKFGENDVETMHILEQHISSIRAICVIPNGNNSKMIVSVGGREQISITEFFDGICREILTHFPSDSSAEGRFMCVDTLISAHSIFIIVGCSDCTIRVFKWTDDLKLAGVIIYTNCILNLCCVRNFVVSFATDGKAVFWNLENGKIPKVPEFSLKLHQSGINSALISEKKKNEFYLITGGDDNMLSVALLKLCEEKSWEMISQWTSSASHSCQITGLVLHNDWLITTSIDQRIVLHKLQTESEKINAKVVGDVMVTVPDAHGLTLIEADSSHVCLCVYGKGIENVQVKLEGLFVLP